MSYAKPTFLQKTGLLFSAAALLAVLATAVFATPVSAQTPPPNAGQCQGDAKSCVCPSDKPSCNADPVFQQCKQDQETQSYKDCKANNDLFKVYVNPFIKFLSLVVGLVVVIGIAIGGMQYITSAGDPQKAAAGKQHIWNAIIGLLVYLFLFAMLNFLIPGGIV